MSEHTPLTEADRVRSAAALPDVIEKQIEWAEAAAKWPNWQPDEVLRMLLLRLREAVRLDAARTSTATADTGHLYAPCKSREEALDELSGHAFNAWCKTNEDTQDDEVIDLFRREFAPWLDRIVRGAADTGLRERVERLCDEFGQATLGTDFFGNPLGGFVPVAHLRALLLDPPMDLLDATAASTADTGARDE